MFIMRLRRASGGVDLSTASRQSDNQHRTIASICIWGEHPIARRAGGAYPETMILPKNASPAMLKFSETEPTAGVALNSGRVIPHGKFAATRGQSAL